MNSRNYEANGYYGHDLDLLTMSHELRASYPTRSKVGAEWKASE